jgi:hypothetical protein
MARSTYYGEPRRAVDKALLEVMYAISFFGGVHPDC